MRVFFIIKINDPEPEVIACTEGVNLEEQITNDFQSVRFKD